MVNGNWISLAKVVQYNHPVKKNLTLSEHLGASDKDAHSRIISSVKRAFSRSPTVTDFLKKHRREEPWIKKDGTKAKKNHVFYPCFKCKKEFSSNKVQVDHIEPVVPVNIPSKHLSYNSLFARLFCNEANLQILCKEHHKEKSQQENLLRDEWVIKTKFIVYETVNRVNGKKYIGVHRCEDYEDFYLGSGNLIKSAVAKYGADNFYRHILFVYDNAVEAFNKEKELVTTEIVDSDEYYNLVTGGSGNVTQNIVKNNKKVICHQTGEIFESINAAATSIGISASSVSVALNKPDCPVKNLHFFLYDVYDPGIAVTFPTVGSSLTCLNNRISYTSVKEAAAALKLNYESLRNSLLDKTQDGVYALDSYCFLYTHEYDASRVYVVNTRNVLCVELNKTFVSCVEAARFLKHKKPNFGSIAIGRAARTGSKMYKYTWKYIKVPTAL